MFTMTEIEYIIVCTRGMWITYHDNIHI
jgi:hypothetical protein